MNVLDIISSHLQKIFPPFQHSSMTTAEASLGTPSVQNVLLIWLDANIDEINDDDSRHTLTELKQVVPTVHTFTNPDLCIAFLSSIREKKVLMIISGALGQTIVPTINDMSHIDSIYVFCRNQTVHQRWALSWSIVKGVFTDIIPICDLLKRAVLQCDQNAISISFVPTSARVCTQHIDQSFMYTQILKEILLTIDFDENSVNEFFIFCREKFIGNTQQLENVVKLEQEYRLHSPIWWYSYECFLYSMLNQALRSIEVDTIIKMGFFLRDLHEQITQLYNEQYGHRRNRQKFTVYRGQRLSRTEYQQMLRTQGGLMSFNNFLSTSKKMNVSVDFARRCLSDPDSIGVLFEMTIDPSFSSTPFASIKNVSRYQTEREILFSMHNVFRIGQIKQIEPDNDRLWQVELTLTDDEDPQRRALTDHIREETQGLTGWHRLGRLLIILGQFAKAEELYHVLLDQSDDELENAHYKHHLGAVKDSQGDYAAAIGFYQESLAINKRHLSVDHPNLASSYTGLGLVYSRIANYSQALEAHRQALEIFQKAFSANNHRLAIARGNIGRVYEQMGDYSAALSFHEKALEIFLQSLPHNHPNIATCNCDLGKVYGKMGDLMKALTSHEKALEIRKNVLHLDHPLLASSYYNVGSILVRMDKHSRALPLFECAIDIGQRSLPDNHPDLELYRTCFRSCTESLNTDNIQRTVF